MVGAALRALLGRLPPPRLDRLAAYCSTWLAGEEPRLKRAAAQVGGRRAGGRWGGGTVGGRWRAVGRQQQEGAEGGWLRCERW